MIWFNHLISSERTLCHKLVNWLISMISCIRYQAMARKTNIIWLQLQNSLFLPCIEENGLKSKTYQSDMVELHHASGKRLEPMEKMSGEFSEFISSKRLNSFALPLLRILGRCTRKWQTLQSSFINLWDFLIDWWLFVQASLTMLLPRNMIYKLGSPGTTISENLFLAQIAPIIRPETWEFAADQKRKMYWWIYLGYRKKVCSYVERNFMRHWKDTLLHTWELPDRGRS